MECGGHYVFTVRVGDWLGSEGSCRLMAEAKEK